jgi:hypothetical protein
MRPSPQDREIDRCGRLSWSPFTPPSIEWQERFEIPKNFRPPKATEPTPVKNLIILEHCLGTHKMLGRHFTKKLKVRKNRMNRFLLPPLSCEVGIRRFLI